MIYEWKSGFHHKVKPEVAGAVFEELEKEKGLTAQTLVDASRPEDAPLHREFEWEDSIAAEKYREQQARVLIAHLTVRMEEVKEAPPTRAYVSLKDDTSKYEHIATVLADTKKTDALFDVAMKELIAFKTKYANLKQFAEVFAAIDKLGAEYYG